jgi:hypothetical protein
VTITAWVVQKTPNSIYKIGIVGVLRLRATQALRHATILSGASLRMTVLWEFEEKHPNLG